MAATHFPPPPLFSGPELYIEIVTEDGTTYIGDIPVTRVRDKKCYKKVEPTA